jgi:dimethylamine--corrinoid protein Co-methyltransferase
VGTGDPLGMEGAHTQASGMGGMRAAGDLVARMQMTRRMRLKEAKEYVAGKLGCGTRDLSDPVAMEVIRQDHGLGLLTMTSSTHPALPGMMEAKFNIGKLLDIPINSVERFKERTTGF